MKVTNLTCKLLLIPVEKAKSFSLPPASGVVELPKGFDKKYIAALTNNGSVKIEVEAATEAKTNTKKARK
jgi:HSP20 family molecular chaperone IbpA